MKKFSSAILVFFIFIFGFLQFQIEAKADDSYDINKYLVNINILKDGNAEVTQKITYDFDGEFHGVYYNQDLKGIKGINDPKIMIKDDQGSTSLVKSNSELDNTFSVDKTSDKMNIKIYHKITDQSATFIYHYKLFGVITNYKDTAALNWKIIGSGWDEPLNNVKISIKLPEKHVNQLQAWSHGPLNGYTDVNKSKGSVTMTVDNVSANQFVESHMIFPTSLTPDNTNIVNKNAKKRILKQEKNLAEQANKQREQPKIIFYIVLIVFILIIVLIYLFTYLSLKKKPIQKHEMPIPINHWFDVPDVSPSMAGIVLDKSKYGSSKGLTGDLLVEVNKRNLEINKKNNTFEIKVLKMPEDAFFQYLFNVIGDGEKVTIKQINKSSESKLFDKFDSWSQRAAKDRDKYFDTNNIHRLHSFVVSAVITTILAAFTGIMGLITYLQRWPLLVGVLLVSLIFAWGSYIYAKKNISVYTAKGEVLANELRGFKQMLKDVEDINVAEVGDLILWEDILPYAVAFGVSDKVIKALKMTFKEEVEVDPRFTYYYWGVAGLSHNLDFTSSITKSIDTANTSNSSVTGGSGGFSGGSSGGFGGGSGGGAF